MTSSDDPRPEPSGQPDETPQEGQQVYRHWLSQLAEHAADGSAAAAGGYVTKKALGKVFGGRGQDKDGGEFGPPDDQGPSSKE
jgi:hypothetical protein